jgi:cytochrome c-type biogenesis protein CcmF
VVDIGHAALLVGLIMAAYAAVSSLVAARTGNGELWQSARNGALAAAALTSLAAGALVYAFFSHDFSVRYVAEYSSSNLSPLYTLSAWWAGLEGSMLLWTWLLAVFTAIVVFQTQRQNVQLAPYITATMAGLLAFFLGLVVFVSNPFERLPQPAVEGLGLNPLLENPGMVVHPPALYIGFVGFSVPFAFAVAALATGRLDDQWIRSSRRWTLFAWLFLGLGNLLGAQWAYVELGWGGYWGWDPVENASFMPWLVGTAFIHSIMIQERRGMLKVWNLFLIIATFTLCLFGTMVTRSGILSSVHTFSGSAIGPMLIFLIAVVLLGSLWLLWKRLPLLRSDHQLDSFISREASFLIANVLLVGAAFAIFWGTIFPLLSEAVQGTRSTVGPAFFQQVTGPIFLATLVLLGICPLLGWRRASGRNLAGSFVLPVAAGLLVAALLYARGLRPLHVVIASGVLAFGGAAILSELYRTLRPRQAAALEHWLLAIPRLVTANRSRFAAFVAHIGVLLLAMGIMASTAYSKSVEATLAPGESAHIQNYDLTFLGLSESQGADQTVVSADLAVQEGGKPSGHLTAEKIFHRTFQNPVSEVGLRSTPLKDLYVVLGSLNDDGSATFRFIVNPLVMWLWIGGGVLIFGTLIALLPERLAERLLSTRPRQVAEVEASRA